MPHVLHATPLSEPVSGRTQRLAPAAWQLPEAQARWKWRHLRLGAPGRCALHIVRLSEEVKSMRLTPLGMRLRCLCRQQRRRQRRRGVCFTQE